MAMDERGMGATASGMQRSRCQFLARADLPPYQQSSEVRTDAVDLLP